MKRVIAFSIIWTTVLLAPVVLWVLVLRYQALPPPSGGPPRVASPPYAMLVTATVIVIVIFAVDVTILWILTKIGGRLKADVKATIEKFGGSIFIAGAGLVGCFLAIALVAFAGIFLLSKLIS